MKRGQREESGRQQAKDGFRGFHDRLVLSIPLEQAIVKV
jgi:hypothetical protein